MLAAFKIKILNARTAAINIVIDLTPREAWLT